MLRRALSDYGVPDGGYVNKRAVSNAEKELDAAYGNKLFDDVAQLTRMSARGLFRFTTRATNGAAVQTYAMSLWGDGLGFYATSIARSAAGVYIATLPTTMPDGFGVTEPLSLIHSAGEIEGLTECGFVKTTRASNLININLRTTASALSDFTAGTTEIAIFFW